MQTRQIQMNDVMYNAAEQCFEALVTIHDGDCSRKYACSINAPMTMPFAEAALGLSKQAERRHLGRGGMYSELRVQHPAPRNGRPRFDPKAWLEHVVKLPGLRAA
ncbi:MAG TPA: orotidine 5-phosphate decarboxylase [Roseobacter sp.]|uniref:Orotidine 5-phosphate decarboxylase n=1 Tax=marine sediment metagenome TaxID=412755 RepID=A0A0F9LKQ5_9ZZZZ|nr:orotidine 5-phosphate decarboxylase [Roseobacter sp.]HEC71949.1 orotidine 5-phosphate decarboxylase [Roseobacter sp.]